MFILPDAIRRPLSPSLEERAGVRFFSWLSVIIFLLIIFVYRIDTQPFDDILNIIFSLLESQIANSLSYVHCRWMSSTALYLYLLDSNDNKQRIIRNELMLNIQ